MKMCRQEETRQGEARQGKITENKGEKMNIRMSYANKHKDSTGQLHVIAWSENHVTNKVHTSGIPYLWINSHSCKFKYIFSILGT